jgi:hypothetical protein
MTTKLSYNHHLDSTNRATAEALAAVRNAMEFGSKGATLFSSNNKELQQAAEDLGLLQEFVTNSNEFDFSKS